ncbi:MAG: ABC transporter permease, partial [Ramlibacter sp.]
MASSPPTSDTLPRLEQQKAAEGALSRVLGQWTAAQFARPRLLRELAASLDAVAQGSSWDLREAQQLDHVGAQLLWDHWGRDWPA